MMLVTKIIDRNFIKSPRLRRIVTRWLYGNSDTEIELMGSTISINKLHENGYFRAALFSRRSSLFRDEISVILAMGSLFERDTAFIDAGANVGIFSSILSRFKSVYENLGVYAFEVNPDTFSRLKKNAQRHGFLAHQLGLSDQATTQTFIRGAVSHVTAQVAGRNAYHIGGTEFSAPCVPLSAFEFSQRTLIIKIDVEGHELQVLRGAEPFFHAQRVKAVYVDGFQDSGVVDFLRNFGFRFFDGRTLRVTDEAVFSLLAVRS